MSRQKEANLWVDHFIYIPILVISSFGNLGLDLFNMACVTTKFKKSTISAFAATGFLISLFCFSLATPDFYYDLAYGGIAVASILTVYYWRRERRADAKVSSVGVWIILFIFFLFILLFLILPGLG